jgi:hypothetical protein
LCSCCNQGLGNFRDSAANLRTAADYLEQTTVQRVRVQDGVHRLSYPAPPQGEAPVSDLGPLLARRRWA